MIVDPVDSDSPNLPPEGTGPHGYFWDKYVQNMSMNGKPFGVDHYQWPGDEWGNPDGWEDMYEGLFVPAAAPGWMRAIEIGQGSGKYSELLLSRSRACIRAYDVSKEFLDLCQHRCSSWLEAERLSLHLLGAQRPDEMLRDIELAGWRRNIDGFFSIDAMVHVDLQFLIAYLITAGLVLRPGGKLILTLADATTDRGFQKLVDDIRVEFPRQLRPFESNRFAWLSPELVRGVLERIGFEIEVERRSAIGGRALRDLGIVATLASPGRAEALEQYLEPASAS